MVNKTDIVNSLPSDLTVITADGTDKANYDGALIYASDLEGKVTKVNLTENFSLNNENMIDKNISSALSKKSKKIKIYKENQDIIDNSSWVFLSVTPEVGHQILK